jgi:predicted nucleic acid-binding protein
MLNPLDDLHATATRVTQSIHPAHIVTSEMVLVELLNGLSTQGAALRGVAARTVTAITHDPNTTVIPQTRDLFRRAVQLFGDRPDKGWSLTDCASFLIMQDQGISDALAHDQDFEQAGFCALLREPL